METSAVTGLGIPKLREAIRAAVLQAAGPRTDVVAGTAVRCGESLRLAAACFDHARKAVRAGLGEELIATDVQVALNELGKVAGAGLHRGLAGPRSSADFASGNNTQMGGIINI